MKKYKAFTLAEVLVTLIIMGVISALTVPAIKKVSEERTYVSGVKKAYYTASNVIKDIKREEGAVNIWYKSAPSLVKNRMNVANSTPSQHKVTSLSGDKLSNFGQNKDGMSVFVTVDGAIWWILNSEMNTATTNGNFIMLVDINGKNAPNIQGVDAHCFWVASDGSVYPCGGGPLDDEPNCSSSGFGYDCTARILQEGKISW